MPEDVLKKLGAQIRKARKDRDMTEDQLSQLSGISVRHIAKIEKGVMNLSFEVLYQLASILDISLDAIVHPTWDTNDPVLKDIIDSYRSCPAQGRLFLNAAIRAISNEIRVSEQQETSLCPNDQQFALAPQ